jgi:hypothetical protein
VRKFKSQFQARSYICVGVFAAAMFIDLALVAPSDVETPFRILCIAIGVTIAGFLIQGAIRWSARIGSRDVVIVGPTRTVRIPRERVDHFELQERLPFIARAIEVDGTVHPIWAIAIPMKDLSAAKRQGYDRMIAEMNAALA